MEVKIRMEIKDSVNDMADESRHTVQRRARNVDINEPREDILGVESWTEKDSSTRGDEEWDEDEDSMNDMADGSRHRVQKRAGNVDINEPRKIKGGVERVD